MSHNACKENKVTVDNEELQEQIHLIRKIEEQFGNQPDPVYSYNEGEGEIVRNIITTLIQKRDSTQAVFTIPNHAYTKLSTQQN